MDTTSVEDIADRTRHNKKMRLDYTSFVYAINISQESNCLHETLLSFVHDANSKDSGVRTKLKTNRP